MGDENRLGAAVILSLIGGVLILLSGAMMFMMFMYGGWFGMMGGFGGMMGGMVGGYQGMMGSFGVPFSLMGGVMLTGLISGIIVIVGAIMLNARPEEHTVWGTIILAFSIISFLGMGGFFVGAIIGIIGGIFALVWEPPAKT